MIREAQDINAGGACSASDSRRREGKGMRVSQINDEACAKKGKEERSSLKVDASLRKRCVPGQNVDARIEMRDGSRDKESV